MREDQNGKFTPDRQKRYMDFLAKLKWENETADVDKQVWDPFFDLMEKMLLADDVNELMVPALNILINVWSAKPDLVDESGIFDAESLREVDLSRLLRAQNYEVYTDFLITGFQQQFAHNRSKMEELDGKVADIDDLKARIEKLEADISPGDDYKSSHLGSRVGRVENAVARLTQENKPDTGHTGQDIADIAIKSEDIKAKSQILNLPTGDNVSQATSFRVGAPQIDIMSLKTGHNEPLETMQSKELNLRNQSRSPPPASRYGANIDADDRSALKTAISKVVTPTQALEGETLEQLQDRIMNEMLNQLQEKFAEAKQGHEQMLTVQLETMNAEYENKMQNKMATMNQEKASEHRNVLEKRLSEIDTTQQQLIDNLTAEQNRAKESLINERDQTIKTMLEEKD